MEFTISELPRLPRLPTSYPSNSQGRFGGSLSGFWHGIRRRNRARSMSGTRPMTPKRDPSLEQSCSSSQVHLPPIQYQKLLNKEELKCDAMHAFTRDNIKKYSSTIDQLTKDDLSDLTNSYSICFNSFVDVNACFQYQLSTDVTSGLDWVLVTLVFDLLHKLPDQIKQATQKAVEICLMSENRSRNLVIMESVCRDDLRAMLVLLQYPGFNQPILYSQFAHLLRQLATLSDNDKHLIAKWLTEMSSDVMKACITKLQHFISTRLFPPRPQDLPPMSRCSWWIPCAVQTLGIFHSSNDIQTRVDLTEFYNESLDNWDLKDDYLHWRTPVANCSFTFCHYPFMLSINAKRKLLEAHAEQQMIATARDSIIRNLVSNNSPDPDSLFLNITVRRQFIQSDSLAQLSNAKYNIRKKLRIHFAGEPGLDMGGLTKEWFQLIVAHIFDTKYGMFSTQDKSDCYWFVPSHKERSKIDQEILNNYHLVGVLMGLAVYNGVILDLKLPLCCYKKLLSPAVLPHNLNACQDPLGIVHDFTLDDLQPIMPETCKNLQQLLDYEGDVERDMAICFEAGYDYLGEPKLVELKPNGSNIPVTNANRQEYVDRYIDYFLNISIERQFKAFYFGFHLVCSSEILMLLRPVEVELLVCGSPVFDIKQLKDITRYENYNRQDKTIRQFWDVLFEMCPTDQKSFLRFVTGSDRIPAGGIQSLHFKITKLTSTDSAVITTNMLPISHTCFNQLCLPDYQDKKKLRKKLGMAVSLGLDGFYLA